MNKPGLPAKPKANQNIYTVKKEEAAAKKTEAENKEKKKLVMEILAEKQNAALRNMSEEDLQKMLDELK